MSLENILAELYPDRQTIDRVAHEANVDLTHVPVSNVAADTWHAVVKEAIRQNQMVALAAVAMREYPTYAPLHLAVREALPNAALQSSELPVRVGRLEQRVDGHDTLLKRIVAEIDPGPRRRTARAAIYVAVVLLLMSWAVLDTRAWYVANPVQAIVIVAVVVAFVIVVRYVSKPDDGTS